jgi:hypothetical protein
MIQHLYTGKSTIAVERSRGRPKLTKTINREQYGKKVVLEDQLTLLTESMRTFRIPVRKLFDKFKCD